MENVASLSATCSSPGKVGTDAVMVIGPLVAGVTPSSLTETVWVGVSVPSRHLQLEPVAVHEAPAITIWVMEEGALRITSTD